MKLFTQAALVSAIALSGSAYAMQSLDDAALGATTGQDGLTILIKPPAGGIAIDQIAIFDKDALNTAAPTTTIGNEAGAITLGKTGTGLTGTGFSITGGAIVAKIDATGGGNSTASSGAAPMLNINVKLPTDFALNTGDIAVTGATGGAGSQAVTGSGKVFLTSLLINLPSATLNIQLGTPQQGAMINFSGTITNGLSIGTALTGAGGIYLTDNTAGFGGNIGVQKTTITDNGNSSLLTVNANLDAATAANFQLVSNFGTSGTSGAGGLILQFGGTPKFDVYMQGVTFGSSAAGSQVAGESIGDVKITGLNLTGVKVGIQGH